jgi:hypothetical protein
MSSVWIVEQGEYSDYRVVAIYSTEAAAQKAADTINSGLGPYGDKASIEERTLDPGLDKMNEGLVPWRVCMKRDGTVEVCERDDDVAADQDPSVYGPLLGGNRLRLLTACWARDATHAIKIANEQRARLIAEGQWG